MENLNLINSMIKDASIQWNSSTWRQKTLAPKSWDVLGHNFDSTALIFKIQLLVYSDVLYNSNAKTKCTRTRLEVPKMQKFSTAKKIIKRFIVYYKDLISSVFSKLENTAWDVNSLYTPRMISKLI